MSLSSFLPPKKNFLFTHHTLLHRERRDYRKAHYFPNLPPSNILAFHPENHSWNPDTGLPIIIIVTLRPCKLFPSRSKQTKNAPLPPPIRPSSLPFHYLLLPISKWHMTRSPVSEPQPLLCEPHLCLVQSPLLNLRLPTFESDGSICAQALLSVLLMADTMRWQIRRTWHMQA